MLAPIETSPAAARAQFESDGFCLIPQVIPRELIDRVIPHMDDVIAGRYQHPDGPIWRTWNPGDDPQRLVKIDQSHMLDDTIFELVRHPAIGRWAAAITGAKMIQLWATQLLFKPPGGADAGNVGWHQDQQYWNPWFEGEVFTAWLAVSDVGEQSGPMRFVRGSHRAGLKPAGNFFAQNLDQLRQSMQRESNIPWEETSALLPAGGASFHHRFTIHGSGPNVSSFPRRSFALHLRTEKSHPVAGATHEYATRLDDKHWAPILYQAS